jgi:hypothetical protein
MLCVTLILKTFEYVHLIPFVSNKCLDLILVHLTMSRSSTPFNYFGHWVGQSFKGLHLALWEEGDKGPEGKIKLAKDKILKIKPQDASPRDPRESSKRLLSKKQEGPIK